MIINFRSINDEKIWETWDLKNYVNDFTFSPNSSYFLRVQQNWGHENFEKIDKTQKILRDIPKNLKNKSFGDISDILIFIKNYVIQNVLFKNQRKSEKWWGKRWEYKKRIGEQFRKTVENECFGKISDFLINVPKPTENLRKCLKKFWRNFWENLRNISTRVIINTFGIFATLVYTFTMRVAIYDILSMAIIPTLSTSILFCNLCYILLWISPRSVVKIPIRI